jgi:hypothetical protein
MMDKVPHHDTCVRRAQLRRWMALSPLAAKLQGVRFGMLCTLIGGYLFLALKCVTAGFGPQSAATKASFAAGFILGALSFAVSLLLSGAYAKLVGPPRPSSVRAVRVVSAIGLICLVSLGVLYFFAVSVS